MDAKNDHKYVEICTVSRTKTTASSSVGETLGGVPMDTSNFQDVEISNVSEARTVEEASECTQSIRPLGHRGGGRSEADSISLLDVNDEHKQSIRPLHRGDRQTDSTSPSDGYDNAYVHTPSHSRINASSLSHSGAYAQDDIHSSLHVSTSAHVKTSSTEAGLNNESQTAEACDAHVNESMPHANRRCVTTDVHAHDTVEMSTVSLQYHTYVHGYVCICVH
jgi:hypothetical protein